MNIKEALNSKSASTTTSAIKTPLPKEKVDVFYQALQKTNMVDVVEAIKKEKIKKPLLVPSLAGIKALMTFWLSPKQSQS